MQTYYDLVIIAEGLNAAVLLAEAAGKGLKAAVVYKENCGNKNPENIGFSYLNTNQGFLSTYESVTQAIYLKKAAAHLVIPTLVFDASPLCLKSFLTQALVHFIKPFGFGFHRLGKRKCLKYQALKFSKSRMAITLLKMAAERGSDIFQYTTLVSKNYGQDGFYQLSCYCKIKKEHVDLKAKAIIHQTELKNHKNNRTSSNSEKKSCFIFYTTESKQKHNHTYYFNNKNIKIIGSQWFGVLYLTLFSNALSEEEAQTLIFKLASNLDLELDKLKPLTGDFYENLPDIPFTIEYGKKQFSFEGLQSADYFAWASKFINKLGKITGKKQKKESFIRHTVLPGSNLGVAFHPLRIMEAADEKYDLAKQVFITTGDFKKLFYAYGSEIDLIINKAYDYFNQYRDADKAWLMAEMWYCITHEFCLTPAGFIETCSQAKFTIELKPVHIDEIFWRVNREILRDKPLFPEVTC
jgi:hypothetical protein